MLTEKNEIVAIRTTYGETLIELGKQRDDIVVIDADVSCSTQTQMFAKVFPERFFNVGIAEQDAIGTAVGLSMTGKVPFVSAFAIFATGRAYDQVRNSVCYPRFNVKIVATHGGITVGEDGATHQALEDISLMRGIPNMTVIIPSDAVEAREAIKFAADYKGPVYIRLTRNSLPTIFNDEKYKFNLNKAIVIKEGKDISLLANGETLSESLNAAKILEKRGIIAEVINVPVVKPLDKETITLSAQKTKLVVTVENHSIIGGLGSSVCEALSEHFPVIIKRIGIEDKFGQSGKPQELMQEYGLTAEQ
ncbi:MAG: transketolase family protein, partial [Candidatus Gastranaerophilaceae bacterium]